MKKLAVIIAVLNITACNPGTEHVADKENEVVEAIKSSKIMVLIFSENSNNSRQVQKEVSVAVNSEAIIIPFKIDNTSFQGSLELFLSDTHWLDAMNPPTKEDQIL